MSFIADLQAGLCKHIDQQFDSSVRRITAHAFRYLDSAKITQQLTIYAIRY